MRDFVIAAAIGFAVGNFALMGLWFVAVWRAGRGRRGERAAKQLSGWR